MSDTWDEVYNEMLLAIRTGELDSARWLHFRLCLIEAGLAAAATARRLADAAAKRSAT